MKLKYALKQIYPSQGATTVIASFMSGDNSSIKSIDVTQKNVEELEKELQKVKDQQDNCGSDWAWWGYEGTISTLKASVNLLKAAAIVGADNLPDVELPSRDGVVMDIQANIVEFGEKVYREAVKQSKS